MTHDIKIKVEAKDPFEKKEKELALAAFAKLPEADFARVTEIINNKKALATLAENWQMLKGMF